MPCKASFCAVLLLCRCVQESAAAVAPANHRLLASSRPTPGLYNLRQLFSTYVEGLCMPPVEAINFSYDLLKKQKRPQCDEDALSAGWQHAMVCSGMALCSCRLTNVIPLSPARPASSSSTRLTPLVAHASTTVLVVITRSSAPCLRSSTS